MNKKELKRAKKRSLCKSSRILLPILPVEVRGKERKKKKEAAAAVSFLLCRDIVWCVVNLNFRAKKIIDFYEWFVRRRKKQIIIIIMSANILIATIIILLK